MCYLHRHAENQIACVPHAEAEKGAQAIVFADRRTRNGARPARAGQLPEKANEKAMTKRAPKKEDVTLPALPPLFARVKAGDLVIVKYSGVTGRESSPRPVQKADQSWIFVDNEKYSRKTGKAPAKVYEEENEDMEKVRKVERFPARILRVATAEDIAAQQAKEEADRQSRSEIEAHRSRLESLAQFFPEGFRPNVEPSWGANKENFRLEFEDLTEEQVKKLAALIQERMR
jgi:hypothetical protein